MTARQYCGCAGLLVALFACVTQGCAAPAKAPTQEQVAAVVAKARAVKSDACKVSADVCNVYHDAVKAGLVKDDDRAELACAKVSAVCALATP